MLAVCLLACAIAFGADTPEQASNPHRDRNACSVCHVEPGAKPSGIVMGKADALCIGCHDGKHASREIHPVGRAFESPKVTNPGWPLRDGRLGCLTCHDMKPGCTGDLDDQTNSSFLRAQATGQAAQKPFCLNCHQASSYTKVNPHLMLEPSISGSQVIEGKCTFCHDRVLDRETRKRSGNAALRTDVVVLCHDCHQRHRDGIAEKHVGAHVSPEMLARAAIRESIGFGSVIESPLLDDAMRQKRRSSMVPVDSGGRLTCTTCHNPHQAGLFPRQSEMSYRAMFMKPDGHLVSPVRNSAWCRYCHEF